ncbi:MAG: hypothetical protein WC959_02710 [Kiritimatiellales bacterium]
MRSKCKAGAVVGIICGVAFGLMAEVTVSKQPKMPAENVLASYDCAGTGYSLRNNQDGKRDIGQSFRAPKAAKMTAFSLLALGNVQRGAIDAPFTVTVYESSSQSTLGKVISTQNGKFLGSRNSQVTGQWIVFSLEPVSLNEGKSYTIMLSFDNMAIPNQHQIFNHAGGSGYADGRLWQSRVDGNGFSNSQVNDFSFCVQVQP